MQKLRECAGHVIRVDDMDIHVAIWPNKKKPVLAVSFKDGTKIHKIVSFDTVEEADWFIEHCLGAFEKDLDELEAMG